MYNCYMSMTFKASGEALFRNQIFWDFGVCNLSLEHDLLQCAKTIYMYIE